MWAICGDSVVSGAKVELDSDNQVPPIVNMDVLRRDMSFTAPPTGIKQEVTCEMTTAQQNRKHLDSNSSLEKTWAFSMLRNTNSKLVHLF